MKVLYVNPCPACDVKAMTSTDGTQATCESCGTPSAAAGLTMHGGWPPMSRRGPQYVVYYVRFGDRVKVGTTRDLAQRLHAIPHDELLATEPGGFDLEKTRHRQLRASRVAGQREWFHLTEQVREHIAGLSRG